MTFNVDITLLVLQMLNFVWKCKAVSEKEVSLELMYNVQIKNVFAPLDNKVYSIKMSDFAFNLYFLSCMPTNVCAFMQARQQNIAIAFKPKNR